MDGSRMTRFEKKCLIASTGMHLFLLLLLVFGSAFFVSKERPPTNPRVKIYPSRIVEAALAGGGGNPRITPSDDVQKGVPNPAAPVLTTPPAKPQTRPAPPEAKVEKVDKTPPKHKIE